MLEFRKGFLKNTSFFIQILLLFLIVIFGISFAYYLHCGFLFIQNGFSWSEAKETMLHLDENAQLLRQSFFFQTLCCFFFPALILSWIFSDNVRRYLHTEQGFSSGIMTLTILSVLFLMPFLNAVINWTQQTIHFPNIIVRLEEQMQQAEGMVLTTDKYLTFLTNLLIIAVFVAVGEEFFFRGVLQNIFSKVFKNPHAVIWTVGIIFSFVHFQFYGFFARAFLGVYLGYLLYYSKSIWIPVLAHFTQNAMGVISFYSIRDPELLKKADEVGVGSTSWVAWVSLALFSITFALLIRKCKSQDFFS